MCFQCNREKILGIHDILTKDKTKPGEVPSNPKYETSKEYKSVQKLNEK